MQFAVLTNNVAYLQIIVGGTKSSGRPSQKSKEKLGNVMYSSKTDTVYKILNNLYTADVNET